LRCGSFSDRRVSGRFPLERETKPHDSKSAGPKAVGKPADFALFTKGTKAYDQNKGLDVNKDCKVTKAEAVGKVRQNLAEGQSAANRG
jgi:hypothetical protein